jgi:hypothetical protein
MECLNKIDNCAVGILLKLIPSKETSPEPPLANRRVFFSHHVVYGVVECLRGKE